VFAHRAISRGMPRTEETDVPDIRETLAQLDQRLADLRHQIIDLTTEPEAVPPPPPPTRSELALPTLEDLEASGAGPSVSRAGLGTARAQAAADGVARLGSQIEQLLTMRERLLGDARELLAGYARQLRELELEDTSAAQSALELLLSAPRSSQAPPDPSEVPARPAFFEGPVTISVTGANRIQTIQVMEDALSRIRHVERVYVRRWHAGQLSFELTLSAGVELIGELNRVLPFPFAVQSASGQQIAIILEGER
jgi:hypothetical protein